MCDRSQNLCRDVSLVEFVLVCRSTEDCAGQSHSPDGDRMIWHNIDAGDHPAGTRANRIRSPAGAGCGIRRHGEAVELLPISGVSTICVMCQTIPQPDFERKVEAAVAVDGTGQLGAPGSQRWPTEGSIESRGEAGFGIREESNDLLHVPNVQRAILGDYQTRRRRELARALSLAADGRKLPPVRGENNDAGYLKVSNIHPSGLIEGETTYFSKKKWGTRRVLTNDCRDTSANRIGVLAAKRNPEDGRNDRVEKEHGPLPP